MSQVKTPFKFKLSTRAPSELNRSVVVVRLYDGKLRNDAITFYSVAKRE